MEEMLQKIQTIRQEKPVYKLEDLLRNGIYAIINLINGKLYIGSAAHGFKNRWHIHLTELRRNIHGNECLQHSFNKHKESNFRLGILEFVDDKSKLIEREQHYLDTLQPFPDTDIEKGYNICKIAGSVLGLRHSEKTKKLLSRLRVKPKEIRVCRCGCCETFATTLNSPKQFIDKKHVHKFLKGKPNLYLKGTRM